MKATFEVLKERTRILVVLTRYSVCAGDDCDAPDEKAIEAYQCLTLLRLPKLFQAATCHQ